MKMREVAKYSRCFACGDQNEYGLQVKFFADDTGAIAHCTARERFQGYEGILHGGIVATLLDEIMIKAVYARQVVAVTAEMTVRFKKPVRTGDELELTAKILVDKGRMLTAEGECRRGDGELLASATGKYLIISGEFEEELRRSIDC